MLRTIDRYFPTVSLTIINIDTNSVRPVSLSGANHYDTSSSMHNGAIHSLCSTIDRLKLYTVIKTVLNVFNSSKRTDWSFVRSFVRSHSHQVKIEFEQRTNTWTWRMIVNKSSSDQYLYWNMVMSYWRKEEKRWRVKFQRNSRSTQWMYVCMLIDTWQSTKLIII